MDDNRLGVLPVAVVGAAELEGYQIDANCITRDGVGAVRSSYEEVSGPVADANNCNCTTDGPDGFMDLTLKFYTQEIVEAIGEVNNNDEVILVLEGVTNSERPIEGSDCVLIKGSHKTFNRGDINRDGKVNAVDFVVIAENWLESSIIED